MSISQGLKRTMQINRRSTATLFGQRRRTWQEFGEPVAIEEAQQEYNAVIQKFPV
jgi:hypothetical protein